MNNLEIVLESGSSVVVHDMKEIRVFFQGELSETITPDNFTNTICSDGYAYSFIGSEQSVSIKGNKVSYLQFFA